MIIEGFEGREEKMLDFIKTNYCIEWDYDDMYELLSTI